MLFLKSFNQNGEKLHQLPLSGTGFGFTCQLLELPDRKLVFRLRMNRLGQGACQQCLVFLDGSCGHFFQSPLSYSAWVRTCLMKIRPNSYSIFTTRRYELPLILNTV